MGTNHLFAIVTKFKISFRPERNQKETFLWLYV